MEEIKIFENPEFGTIRTVEIDGEAWFVGKDVSAALGYRNARDALARCVEKEDKGVAKLDTPGGLQNLTTINESGVYSLIMSSKLPTAKKFKHWVTSEILPSVRKNGGYIKEQENLSDSEIMAKALFVAQKVIDAKQKEIDELKPKALFADAVTASDTSITVGALAKILQQNGVNIGQNRLFQWMRESGYLISKKCADRNLPKQRAMEKGLFEVHSSTYEQDGRTFISRTVRVTTKGQEYFIKKFLK